MANEGARCVSASPNLPSLAGACQGSPLIPQLLFQQALICEYINHCVLPQHNLFDHEKCKAKGTHSPLMFSALCIKAPALQVNVIVYVNVLGGGIFPQVLDH